MEGYSVHLKPNEVLCREGDREIDLYIVAEGELAVLVVKGTQVTAVATLGKGAYIGELSFFDQFPRGANIVATTECKLVQIPSAEIRQQFPAWILTLGKALATKLRSYDEVIRQKGIKKKTVEALKPLTMDEQRHFYKILSK